MEQSRNESARLPSPTSSQLPGPSPDSKRNQRKYASNRQAHQSTPLLENCVALIRHVIQQLVHLRVFENERLPTLQADQNVTSNFHKPPFLNHVRTVVASVQLKTVLNHEGKPKTHLHSGKSVSSTRRKLHPNLHQHGFHSRCSTLFLFRKCAVAWTKWPRAHPSSSRPPA